MLILGSGSRFKSRQGCLQEGVGVALRTLRNKGEKGRENRFYYYSLVAERHSNRISSPFFLSFLCFFRRRPSSRPVFIALPPPPPCRRRMRRRV